MKTRRFPLPALLIGMGSGLLVLLLGFSSLAPRIENHFFDTFSRWDADSSKWPEDVVVLLIDDASLNHLGGKYGWRWPWPRDAHAALIACLKKAGAKSVMFDVLFVENSEDALQDDILATYVKASGNVWLAALQQTDQPPQNPIPSLLEAAGSRVGFVNADRDPDGTLRSYPLKDIWNHSHRLPLATGFSPDLLKNGPSTPLMRLRWYADISQLPRFLSAGPFYAHQRELMDKARSTMKNFDELDPTQVAAFIDSLPILESAKVFHGKNVFVGCSGIGTFDSIATPLNGYSPGVMVHPTAYTNLLRGDYIRPVAPWIHGLIGLLACGITTLGCIRIRKITLQAFLTIGILASLFGSAFFIFTLNHHLAVAIPMLAVAVSYSAITTWNYFTEGKQRQQARQLFSDFVSPDVLAELEETGLNLRGDARLGTVLFCDLAGFTTFIETAPSEQSIQAINRYLADASKILIARRAYVDKFIGDAVMALFNIPAPLQDHAIQACHAALDFRKMMEDLNKDLGEKHGLSLSLRTGIHTGTMIAGPMGYARKWNYSALGDTVNLASRLEGANKAYHTSIMIGPETYNMAKDHFETRFLDLLRVKGKNIPVRVYELVALRGDLTEKQKQIFTDYNTGMEHYRQRRWGEARSAFQRALDVEPSDGPSQTYVDRCEFYIKDPPPSDWDGSFGLDSK